MYRLHQKDFSLYRSPDSAWQRHTSSACARFAFAVSRLFTDRSDIQVTDNLLIVQHLLLIPFCSSNCFRLALADFTEQQPDHMQPLYSVGSIWYSCPLRGGAPSSTHNLTIKPHTGTGLHVRQTLNCCRICLLWLLEVAFNSFYGNIVTHFIPPWPATSTRPIA